MILEFVVIKRTLIGLLSLIGLGGAAEPKTAMMDPKDILMSISTISEDAAPVVPMVGKVAASDVLFHEDDWRQIEFFPKTRLETIKATLSELKAFETAHRAPGGGWTELYLRKPEPKPVLKGPRAVASLERTLGVTAGPGPVLYYGQQTIVGRVANGFSLTMEGGVDLYGFTDASGIAVLGVNFRLGGDDMAVARLFAALNASDGLIAVDWRQQLLLISVAENGDFEIWQP